MSVTIERIYGSTVKENTYRILIDRLWPRGISKEKAQLNLWAKEIAPTNELRKWFGHDPAKFAEFKQRYLAELVANPQTAEFIDLLQKQNQKSDIVLLYGAKDQQDNQAQVLISYLAEQDQSLIEM
ncbi:DUF488 domain-containing protein [Lapidilactobacillus bayanensis]|uniref:DUF488 domain-containing protein n=1 Tax=Lapidilactobacillus bayanensis TaxID=2485998 RepID=UPI000F7802FB|nr:DUF488 family protein [Lapidilactobacillus bayanensis]